MIVSAALSGLNFFFPFSPRATARLAELAWLLPWANIGLPLQGVKRLAAALGLLLLLVPSAIQAGTVETAEGRFEGEITFHPDAVHVGDKEIAFADILYVVADPDTDRPVGANLIRLQNGEVWAGEIISGSAKKIDLRNAWFGQKSFDQKSISVLDFAPQEPAPSASKRLTLYRMRQRPLPGTLMWIDKDSLGLDSPLGSVTIKRAGLLRYVLAGDPGVLPVGDSDEIGLIDGNIFHGRLQAKAGQLGLQHQAGGAATFPADAVSYIVRHNPTIMEFSQLSPEVVTTGESNLDKGTQRALSGTSREADIGAPFVRASRIEPTIKIRYALPERDGKKILCRATLDPIQGAVGDTQIKLLVGEQVVLDKTLSATEGPQPFEVEIPAGDTLTIDVGFGSLLRFPCGVLLKDAHLVLVK